MKILLLDDDEQDIHSVKRHLRESQLSATVITCENGNDALEKLDGGKPDEVLVKHQPDSGRANVFVNQVHARGCDVPMIILAKDLVELMERAESTVEGARNRGSAPWLEPFITAWKTSRSMHMLNSSRRS